MEKQTNLLNKTTQQCFRLKRKNKHKKEVKNELFQLINRKNRHFTYM